MLPGGKEVLYPLCAVDYEQEVKLWGIINSCQTVDICFVRRRHKPVTCAMRRRRLVVPIWSANSGTARSSPCQELSALLTGHRPNSHTEPRTLLDSAHEKFPFSSPLCALRCRRKSCQRGHRYHGELDPVLLLGRLVYSPAPFSLASTKDRSMGWIGFLNFLMSVAMFMGDREV